MTNMQAMSWAYMLYSMICILLSITGVFFLWYKRRATEEKKTKIKGKLVSIRDGIAVVFGILFFIQEFIVLPFKWIQFKVIARLVDALPPWGIFLFLATLKTIEGISKYYTYLGEGVPWWARVIFIAIDNVLGVVFIQVFFQGRERLMKFFLMRWGLIIWNHIMGLVHQTRFYKFMRPKVDALKVYLSGKYHEVKEWFQATKHTYTRKASVGGRRLYRKYKSKIKRRKS